MRDGYGRRELQHKAEKREIAKTEKTWTQEGSREKLLLCKQLLLLQLLIKFWCIFCTRNNCLVRDIHESHIVPNEGLMHESLIRKG